MKERVITTILILVLAMTMGFWQPSHAQSKLAEDAPQVQPKADQLPSVRDLLDALDVAALKMNWSEKEQKAASESAGAAATAYDAAAGAYFAAAKSSEQKETVSQQADRALTFAKTNQAKAARALAEARTTLTAAQTRLQTARTDRIAKSNLAEIAAGNAEVAEYALEQAQLRWSHEKDAAAKELAKAEEDSKDVGYDFINAGIEAMGPGYYTIDMIIANEKSSDYTVTAWDRETKLTMEEIVSDRDFLKIVKDICSYDNLQQGVEFLRHVNQLRSTERHDLPKLGVNYQLIANAVVSTAVSAYGRGHNLIESSNYRYWTVGSTEAYRPRSENLAYSSTPVKGKYDYDPFDSWYYEDRIIQKGLEQGGITQSIIDQVIAEARADGRDYNPYRNTSRQAFLQEHQQETTVDHYLAIVEPELTAMGAAYACIDEKYREEYMTDPDGWNLTTLSSLEFSNAGQNTISIDQYTGEMDSFFKDCAGRLEAARDKVSALEAEPFYVADAKERLSIARGTLKDAKDAAVRARQERREAEDALLVAKESLTACMENYNAAASDVSKAEARAQRARQDAQITAQAEEMKETDRDAAEQAMLAAVAALTEAEAKGDRVREHYESALSFRMKTERPEKTNLINRLIRPIGGPKDGPVFVQ